MNSVVSKRRRFVLWGVVGTSVLSSFMACSGSSERRTARDQGAAGDGRGATGGDAGNGPQHGGSTGLAGSGEAEVGGAPQGGAGRGTAGDRSSSGGDVSTDGGGAGGDSSSAAGAGGDPVGGQGGSPGAGGEGGQAPHVDPVCGVGMVQVGAYSLWCGKVNMHTNQQGTWVHDADCTSGCNILGVGYCQKFYPTATAIAAVPQLETKDWKNAGCDDSAPDGPGISGQAACCAPAP